MTKSPVPQGNGAALVIDDQNLILSAPEANQAEAELLASLERVNQTHHVTLKKLAR